MRAISATRSSPSTASRVTVVVVPRPHGLVDDVLGRGERRHLGEVGHHEHLARRRRAGPAPRRRRSPRCRRCRRRPRRTRASGPVSHRRREREPQRQHRPRQLAARRHPGERQQRRTGVGGEQERDVVAGVVAVVLADLHRDLGVRQGQLAQARLRPPSASSVPRPAGGRADGPGGGEFVGERLAARSCVERRGAGVELLQLVEARLGLGVERHHRGQVVAVLAAQVLAAAADVRGSLRAARRPRRSTSAARRTSATTSSTSAEHAVQPLGDLGVGRPPVERRRAPRPSASRRAVRRRRSAATAPRRRLAVRDGVAEQRLLGVEARVLVGIGDAGPSSSSSWKRSRSISRARTRSSPPSAASSASISVSRARAARSGSRSTPAEPVERGALRRRSTAGSGGRAGRGGRPGRRLLGQRRRPWPVAR